MPANRSNMWPVEQVEREVKRLFARMDALEECAGHLDLDWTDDALEREEGKALSALWRKQAERVRTRAQELQRAARSRRELMARVAARHSLGQGADASAPSDGKV